MGEPQVEADMSAPDIAEKGDDIRPLTTTQFAALMGVSLKKFNGMRQRAHLGKFPRPLNSGDRYLLWPRGPVMRFITEGKV